tara:strand:+ start:187 stop:570 length:384 start_codon:yes stop_codon:yes gene_type:complete
MKKVKLIFCIALATILISCKKDKESPVITITQPTNHSNHNKGEMLHIDANFDDDVELANYSIYIGDENGDHSADFHFMVSEDISGKSFELHKHIMIPDTVGMVYYLFFNVTDAEEKSTSESIMLHFM